ncbi:MAG TPA: single-stranded-DNA-specific exonuclease RecJ [Paludibacteraceae bacterium]|mgnify:FL=1|nr:single-stranded-DNA-specific exonuclease RecJ [Paludibacteraceae bacterium]HOJ65414.1 single-stranded-DNA-specific exonuclease RecJ [Paludibacteraceae bacterium]HOL28732.1 single-stranded-DNA-specific exonuclease RecJ [Paludibacteraceae bacterium]HPQ12929.1 single-stranded-DNA-specific exonuclease RecJ [Paludibacteraceae bacterium]
MTNKWIFKSLSEEEKIIQKNLVESLSINPTLAQLLVQRGIQTFEEARSFFRPDLAELHDPFLMMDMDKAIERLNKAIDNKEKILIYGDYDVDGTTSVALVYQFLKKYYSDIDFYIPDRYTEGYGISFQGIQFAAEQNFSLIIALDCGIKATEKVKHALNLGIDFIICDHHTPDKELPPAVAILDPKREDCPYPYKHLSGCGVGFKLLQAFTMKKGIDFSELTPLLDLVGLSIASDIVPITGENRILAYYGLKRLNSLPSLGIRSIINVCGLADREITISDIVFKIGPRINASGRMKSAREAVELLIANDAEIARQKSGNINEYNNDRKDIDKNITDEAISIINSQDVYKKRKSIVVYQPHWHKGVIGIVASRLSDEYYKPTVVLTRSNGLISGSARSVPGFDLYKAIDSCRDLLENFGGHMYAAGLSMKEENIQAFTERFEQFVSENILEEQTYPQLEIDAVLEFKDITPKFFRILKQFAPFGPENMKPLFVSKKIFDYGTSRLVGKEQEHLRMELIDSSSENVMNGIAFGMHEYNDHLKALHPLDICYTLEENNFNGNSTIQLMIRDIKTEEY